MGQNKIGDYVIYRISDEIIHNDIENFCDGDIIVGYLNIEEIKKYSNILMIDDRAINESTKSNKYFKSIFETGDDFIYGTIKLIDNSLEKTNYISYYIKEEIVLFFDNKADDKKIGKAILNTMGKVDCDDVSCEKIIYMILDSFICDDLKLLEKLDNIISKMEEMVENNKTKKDFNLQLLSVKNKLLNIRNYYESMIDLMELFIDNSNDIFSRKNIKYFKYLQKRIVRFKDYIDVMRDNVVHLRDAYQSYLELKLNSTMKILTVFTVFFSPLTLITGWFGMNFHNMPMINWRYGYLLVEIFTLILAIVLFYVFKKKKLF